MGDNDKYLGFEDLPVFNFYKISNTQDVRWFYKKYRGQDDFKLPEGEEPILLERFKKTYDRRIKYTNDVKSVEYYRKLEEVSNLETKLFRLQSSFNVIIKLSLTDKLFNDYVIYFRDDEKLDFKKEVLSRKIQEEYLLWLQRKIKGFSTKTKVRKALYKDILEPKKITTEENEFDIVKEKVLLQEVLSMPINIYTCPLIEWCAMTMRAEAKSKEAKKQIEKIKNKR